MLDSMNILVCLNANHVPYLRVMITSLCLNNPGERVGLWVLHRSIPEADIAGLAAFCEEYGIALHPRQVDDALFRSAPESGRYPQEIYYRLLAPHLLPGHLRRVIYLDTDTLIINPLRPLWELDMQGNLFAAASHTGKTDIATGINRVRLKTEHDYFNSGVLLMDLDRGREEVLPADIHRYIQANQKILLLPDQDVLNALYGKRILELDDAVWNYDCRNYSAYIVASMGRADMDWVLANTAILHFCGKSKPWQPGYRHRFGVLYRHYMQIAGR